MKLGELYRVFKASTRDPKKSRIFVVVSRQALLDSRFSSAICAPIYSAYDGLSTQVPVGVDEGLKHNSSIHCDELVSIPKEALTNFIGALNPTKLDELKVALTIALSLERSV